MLRTTTAQKMKFSIKDFFSQASKIFLSVYVRV